MSDFNIKDTVEELKIKAMKVYEELMANESYREHIVSGAIGGSMLRYMEKSYKSLKKAEFNIGVVGVQSSGKTSVQNTLLGYPYMPVAGVETTFAVCHVRYGDRLGIEVAEIHGGEESSFTVDLYKLTEDFFNELKLYACSCIKLYDIEQMNYFIRDEILDDKGYRIVKPEDLILDYQNIRHRAVLALNALLFYVDTDANSSSVSQSVLELIEWRRVILRRFGFSENTKEYTVTFYCNSAILQHGVFFTDLPGLGGSASESICDEGKTKTVYLHDKITLDEAEKADVLMIIMTPTMDSATQKPMKDILSMYAGQSIANAGNRLIPIVNQIDRVKGKGYRTKVETLYRDIGLDLDTEKTIDISTWYAEKALFDANEDFFLSRSRAAEKMPAKYKNDYKEIKDEMGIAYENSNFDEIRNCISEYYPRAVATEALQLMAYVYQEISSVVAAEKSKFEVNTRFLQYGSDVSIELMQTLNSAIETVIDKGTTTYGDAITASEKLLELDEEKLEEPAIVYESKILEDHRKMAGQVREYGEKLLSQANMFGDIVLSRKDGAKKIEENINNWEKLKKTVFGEDYEASTKYFEKKIKEIDNDCVEHIKSADEGLRELIKRSGENLQNELEIRKQNAVSQIEQKNLSGSTLEIIDFVIGQMQMLYEGIPSQIETSMQAQNREIDEQKNKILAEMAKDKLKIKEAHKKKDIEFLESIVESGVLFTKVKLIRAVMLSDAMDNKLDLSEDDLKSHVDLFKNKIVEFGTDYVALFQGKASSLINVWGEINKTLLNVTKDIVSRAGVNSDELKQIIAEKRSFIASFSVDDSVKELLDRISSGEFFAGFSKEREKIQVLQKNIAQMQKEVNAQN